MFHIVLVEPEIPPNTGNIIRLAANTGCYLHLIQPLGFKFDDQRLKRAGLDYHEFSSVEIHKNFQAFLDAVKFRHLYAIETCGTTCYSHIAFEENDALVFGSETKGLSEKILAHFAKENILKIPMQAGNRSLNLSNSVAVVVYEAWRQRGFGG